MILSILWMCFSLTNLEAAKPVQPVAVPQERTLEKPKKELEKTPKALFLIKRAKIGSDVGEPQMYPGEAQLRTVINEPALQSTKNFE